MNTQVYITNIPDKNINTEKNSENNQEFNIQEDLGEKITKTQDMPEAPNYTNNYNEPSNNYESISFEKREDYKTENSKNNKRESKVVINQNKNIIINNDVQNSSERTKEKISSKIRTTNTGILYCSCCHCYHCTFCCCNSSICCCSKKCVKDCLCCCCDNCKEIFEDYSCENCRNNCSKCDCNCDCKCDCRYCNRMCDSCCAGFCDGICSACLAALCNIY